MEIEISLPTNKSHKWSCVDLEKALKSLKNSKSRDPSGLINELFKPPVIGDDLKLALLRLVNGIKNTFIIPPQLQLANVTTIYKKKGSKLDLDNDRGIFGLSLFRKL